MVRGAVLSPELARTIHRMRRDGMKLAEISPLVGLSISWISEILRVMNAETGKKRRQRRSIKLRLINIMKTVNRRQAVLYELAGSDRPR